MTDKLAGTKPPTASEVWFDTYLRAHGYTWVGQRSGAMRQLAP
jgi:hypothetical protein